MRLVGEVARDGCHSTQVGPPPFRGSFGDRDQMLGCISVWGNCLVKMHRVRNCIPDDGYIFLEFLGPLILNACCSLQIGGNKGICGLF